MNKKQNVVNVVSLVLALVLCAAITLSLTACDTIRPETPATTTTVAGTTTIHTPPTQEATAPTAVGVGATVFTFEVHAPDGAVTTYEVSTDEATVGQTLLNLNLIDGEDSQYGLYVKTVAGMTLDFNKDGKYWAFYVDGNYAMSGVDTTNVQAGATYAFKAE